MVPKVTAMNKTWESGDTPRPGRETPVGSFQVLAMQENPTWQHPLTGKIIPPGQPGNPMGRYWIEFSTDGKTCLGFHGTPEPKTIGKAASHGCVRMYPQDIEKLFHLVCPGTRVTVIH